MRVLVATKTFDVMYNGRLERIIAGRSYVEAGHQIARARPDAFAQEHSAVARFSISRSGGYRPSESPGASAPQAEVLALPSLRTPKLLAENPEGFSVVLSAPAARALRREAARGLDGTEWGGYLMGLTPCHGDRRLRVVEIAGAGPDAIRTEDSLTYDLDEERAAARSFLLRMPPGLRVGCVGRFHTHEDVGFAAQPSEADLQSWALNLERNGPAAYIGLISYREGGHSFAGWCNVRADAFVAYHDRRSGAVEVARAELLSETH